MLLQDTEGDSETRDGPEKEKGNLMPPHEEPSGASVAVSDSGSNKVAVKVDPFIVDNSSTKFLFFVYSLVLAW